MNGTQATLFENPEIPGRNSSRKRNGKVYLTDPGYRARVAEYRRKRFKRPIDRWVWVTLSQVKGRAKAKGLQFNLDEAWLRKRYTGRCEVTKVELRIEGPLCPWSASLDRERPEFGYVKSNVRIVAWGWNALKGTGTDAQVREFINQLRGEIP